MRSRRPSRRLPKPHPKLSGCGFVHATGTYPTATSQSGSGGQPLWIRGIKVRRTGFFFLAEQAPGSVTGDGQDELVVRT
ncbi:hypothetical protein BJV77DRAFT_977241, partial [Russula vinacea]